MQNHENTTIGGVTWHSSEEDGGPDVGISVYLGKDDRLWAGEVTSKLFNENDGAANFVSDGGWFLIRYKGEETRLIAKFRYGLEAREFIEEVASWHVRLAAAPAASGGVREPMMITVEDEQYARDLLDDLKGRDRDSPVAIAAQWFRKARHEHALALTAPPLPADGVREAIECERQRQIGKGYNAAHDDTHVRGEIATAAAVYALHPFRWHLVMEGRSGRRLLRRLLSLKDFWPWEWESFRPSDRRENLIKAAALTIAEIERLDRAALAAPHEQGEG